MPEAAVEHVHGQCHAGVRLAAFALRRLAVYAWRRGFALPTGEIARFLDAGYTEAQIETLVISVTGMRVGSQSARAAA